MINGIKITDFNLRHLAENSEKENKRRTQIEQKEIIRRLRIQNKKLQEQLTEARRKLKRSNADKTKVVAKISRTKKLNELLSGALGSCNRCWGEDPNCANCSGDGISGWRKINKKLFNTYVLPALENRYHLSRKIK